MPSIAYKPRKICSKRTRKTAASATPASASKARRLTCSVSSCARQDGARFYRDKVTGARADRRELLKLLKAIGPGDVLMVTRIDGLARSACSPPSSRSWTPRRNSGHWRNRGRHWHRHRAADDCTARRAGRREARSNPHRTAEGRSRAKARGQHMGRPPKLTPQQQKEARRRRHEGATLKELAKSYNVGRATISRLSPSL